MMTAFDPSPLFRSAIGFDRLSRLVDSARAASEGSAYPPYNIEKLGDDAYVLTMAVAGFAAEFLRYIGFTKCALAPLVSWCPPRTCVVPLRSMTIGGLPLVDCGAKFGYGAPKALSTSRRKSPLAQPQKPLRTLPVQVKATGWY